VEIVKQGRQAIIDYYAALEEEPDRPLNESKLILIGDGAAGILADNKSCTPPISFFYQNVVYTCLYLTVGVKHKWIIGSNTFKLLVKTHR
jgi:hypothetical protein